MEFRVQLLIRTLLVYMIYLAFVPCSDSFPLSVHLASSSMQDEQEDPCGTPDDHCTPFCICACCGAVLDIPPVSVILDEPQSLPHLSTAQPHAPKNWNLGIYADGSWQPPKYT